MRPLNSDEKKFITYWLSVCEKNDIINNIENEKVIVPPDGMGSLYFVDEGLVLRKYYKKLVEIGCKDNDDIQVFVNILLSEDNKMSHLDIWKVDYSDITSLLNLRPISIEYFENN